MKVQATRPVKDEETGEQAQKEDPAHMVNWRPGMKAACKRVLILYDQPSHPTWEHLFEDVSKRFGKWLGQYETPDRHLAYERIAMNVLIAEMKRRSPK